jgi:hypothetical protein
MVRTKKSYTAPEPRLVATWCVGPRTTAWDALWKKILFAITDEHEGTREASGPNENEEGASS